MITVCNSADPGICTTENMWQKSCAEHAQTHCPPRWLLHMEFLSSLPLARTSPVLGFRGLCAHESHVHRCQHM